MKDGNYNNNRKVLIIILIENREVHSTTMTITTPRNDISIKTLTANQNPAVHAYNKENLIVPWWVFQKAGYV